MALPSEEFTNLKVHTQYSICEGAIKIDDLANYCKINKIKATNSYIGIASKDGSESIVKNIDFVEVEIPFASYQKKKSYNYGLLKIDEPINLNKYTMKSIKDPNSKIDFSESGFRL